MTLPDKEILDSFATEIRDLIEELKEEIRCLLTVKIQDAKNYENFGQIIDRIYGTATTLGYQDFGEYARGIKAVCYKCAQCDPENKGREKTVHLMIESLKLMELMAKYIHNKDEMKKVRTQLSVEKFKAEKLCRSVFYSISKTSCD